MASNERGKGLGKGARGKRISANIVQYKDKDGREGILPVYPSSTAHFAEAYCPVELDLPKGTAGNIPLGIGFDVPEGHIIVLFPDNRLFLKGIFIQAAAVDRGDKGPIVLPCVNMSGLDVHLARGDIIAHACLMPSSIADNWSRKVSVQVHPSAPPEGEKRDMDKEKKDA